MSSRYDDSIWELVPDAEREPDPWLAQRAARFVADADGVLDLGCGDGLYLRSLATRGARLYCADRSQVALERAVRRAPAVSAHLVDADEYLPLADNCVQRVWCCDTLEHVVDTQTVLSEARRVLSPGGELLVVTPDHRLWRRLRLALGGWHAHFDPFSPHLRFYTVKTLRGALVDCGFEAPAIERHGGALVALAQRR